MTMEVDNEVHPDDTGKSVKVEVQADSTGKWCGNALRWPRTEAGIEAAREYGADLAGRWHLVTAWRLEYDDRPAPVPDRYAKQERDPMDVAHEAQEAALCDPQD